MERSSTGAVPKDAAAVILLRQDTDPTIPRFFWVQRSDKLAFLGGFHAFPGGQIDADGCGRRRAKRAGTRKLPR